MSSESAPSHRSTDDNRPVIWIVNQHAITPDLSGGTRHYDFGSELTKRGYRIRILASERQNRKVSQGDLFRSETVNGVVFTWIKVFEYERNDWRRVLSMLTFAWNAVRVGMKIPERPKTVIGSSPHLLAAVAGWALARLKKARFVLELRDLWPQALIDLGGIRENSLVGKVLRVLEFFLYRVALKIIILAPGSKNYLQERRVRSEKIVYIPNGVHFGHFGANHAQRTHTGCDYSAQEIRNQISSGVFTAVYAGAHGPANSLETVLDAAGLLLDRRDIEIVLVGDGPSKEALVRESRQRNLTNLRFLPPVPKNQIPVLLEACDAAIITLRRVNAFAYGVSPNKLFDYMAAGKPVVCAVPGYMAKLVESVGAGISVEAEDPKALAEALIKISSLDISDRARMGRNGRNIVEQEFRRERLADVLETVL